MRGSSRESDAELLEAQQGVPRIGCQDFPLVDDIENREAAGKLDRPGDLADLHIARGDRQFGGKLFQPYPAEVPADGSGRCLRKLPCISLERSALLNLLNDRSEEHTSELQSLMRISYAVFCLK